MFIIEFLMGNSKPQHDVTIDTTRYKLAFCGSNKEFNYSHGLFGDTFLIWRCPNTCTFIACIPRIQLQTYCRKVLPCQWVHSHAYCLQYSAIDGILHSCGRICIALCKSMVETHAINGWSLTTQLRVFGKSYTGFIVFIFFHITF